MEKLNNNDYNAFGHYLRKPFNATHSKQEDRWNKKMFILSSCLSGIGIIPVFLLNNPYYRDLAIIGWMTFTILGVFIASYIIKKFWRN